VRIAGGLSTAMLVAVAIASLVEVWAPVGLLLTALLLGIAAYVWRVLVTPYIALTATHVVVQNEMRQIRVPRQEVETIEPGPEGLRVVGRDIDVLAIAVCKSDLPSWARARGRADRIAAELLTAVHADRR